MIAYLRNLKETVSFVNSLAYSRATIGCCSISVTEIYAGRKEKEHSLIENLIESLKFFPINLEIAKMAGDIMRDYRSRGITLGLTDATIAATAIYYDLILVTYNKKHYPMNELLSISPKDSI